MPKIQWLAAHINIGGDRDNVVVRDQFDPITYPEALVLQVVHGGPDHVHTLIETKRTEVNAADERQRLVEKYGKIVNEIFPSAAGTGMLPLADDSLPTLGDVKAANDAAAKALATRRAKKAKAKQAGSTPEDAEADADAADLAAETFAPLTNGGTPTIPNLTSGE